jgi:hypothetical protein
MNQPEHKFHIASAPATVFGELEDVDRRLHLKGL